MKPRHVLSAGSDVGDEVARHIWPPQPLLGEVILEATLDLVTSLVTSIVEGADGISVSLVSRGGGLHTPTATSAEVREVDAVQYTTGRGPCVEATRTGEVVNIVVASEHGRWPEFTKEAASRRFGSVLSVPLLDRGHPIGALNVYSERSDPFSEHDRCVVGHFAHHAAVVLERAAQFMTGAWINEQLAEAESRAEIVGQAKGILVANGYSADEALATLRRASERSNRQLSEVAQDIVASSRRGRPS
jgi:GAF domain-containing protein